MSDYHKTYALLLITLFYFWHCCVCPTNAQSADNCLIEKSYLCEEVPNQKIQMSIVPKTFNRGAQVLDVTLITPVPLGNELRLGISAEIEIKLGGRKQWQRLFHAEDDFCRIIQVYLGELVYGLETAMGIPRGACPIARGHYHAVNYTMDFSRFKLQLFPVGKLRTVVTFLDKPNKNALLCIVVIASTTA